MSRNLFDHILYVCLFFQIVHMLSYIREAFSAGHEWNLLEYAVYGLLGNTVVTSLVITTVDANVFLEFISQNYITFMPANRKR